MAARTKPGGKELQKIEKRIVSVDEVDPLVKVLVYGVNGSGKTRFAATAPNVIIADINEQGTRSARHSGAHMMAIDKWDDIGQLYWYLKAGNHEFDSVALDTLTAMQNLAMSFVLGEAEERDPSRERGMPDKRSYGRAGELMKGMMLAYRNLPMHVIFTAQERTITDDDTGETTDITVDLPAGSRGTAMGCVGVVGRMMPREVKVRNKQTKKTTKRWVDHLLVGQHEVIRSKDRTGLLGRVVQQPNMSKVIKAWTNGDEEE